MSDQPNQARIVVTADFENAERNLQNFQQNLEDTAATAEIDVAGGEPSPEAGEAAESPAAQVGPDDLLAALQELIRHAEEAVETLQNIEDGIEEPRTEERRDVAAGRAAGGEADAIGGGFIAVLGKTLGPLAALATSVFTLSRVMSAARDAIGRSAGDINDEVLARLNELAMFDPTIQARFFELQRQRFLNMEKAAEQLGGDIESFFQVLQNQLEDPSAVTEIVSKTRADLIDNLNSALQNQFARIPAAQVRDFWSNLSQIFNRIFDDPGQMGRFQRFLFEIGELLTDLGGGQTGPQQPAGQQQPPAVQPALPPPAATPPPTQQPQSSVPDRSDLPPLQRPGPPADAESGESMLAMVELQREQNQLLRQLVERQERTAAAASSDWDAVLERMLGDPMNDAIT